MRYFLIWAVLLSAALVGAQEPSARKPTLYIIGDSTVANGSKGLQGWGVPIAELFDTSKIKVANLARGGRSSRSFRAEGLWEKIVVELKAGDFVLMQFGHNDGGSPDNPNGRPSLKGIGEQTQEVADAKSGKKEIVHTFGWYMRMYAAETKAKGATPIVLSHIPRNVWKGEVVTRAANDYGKWSAEAAKTEGAIYVDLNEIVAVHYEKLGQEKVQTLFGTDRTHTNQEGARLNAELLAEQLRRTETCSLRDFLRPAAKTGATTRIAE